MNRLCTHGKEFAGMVGKHEGWQLVNEGSKLKQKWGFVTKQVGMLPLRQLDGRQSETAPAAVMLN